MHIKTFYASCRLSYCYLTICWYYNLEFTFSFVSFICIFILSLQKENNLAYNEEDVKFFEHQLDLFGKLAFVSIF